MMPGSPMMAGQQPMMRPQFPAAGAPGQPVLNTHWPKHPYQINRETHTHCELSKRVCVLVFHRCLQEWPRVPGGPLLLKIPSLTSISKTSCRWAAGVSFSTHRWDRSGMDVLMKNMSFNLIFCRCHTYRAALMKQTCVLYLSLFRSSDSRPWLLSLFLSPYVCCCSTNRERD